MEELEVTGVSASVTQVAGGSGLAGGDERVVVKLAGEIDISNAQCIREALDEIDTSPGIVFDLSELEFLDSSGLAVLLSVVARSASVELANPSRIIRRVVEASGLSDVLRTSP